MELISPEAASRRSKPVSRCLCFLTAAHRCVQTILPPVVHRFLFSQSEEFPVARPLFRALFGVATGTGNTKDDTQIRNTSSDTPGRFISELRSSHVGNQRGHQSEKTPQSCAHFGADQLFGGNRSAHRISLSLNNFIHCNILADVIMT